MELKEYCPNCHRPVTLQQISGMDLLDEVEAIACITFTLLGASVGIILLLCLRTVFPNFTPGLIMYGIAAIVVAIPVFFISLRWLTAFERSKLRSLEIQKFRLKCSCFPQDIVVVRPTTISEDNAAITGEADTTVE